MHRSPHRCLWMLLAMSACLPVLAGNPNRGRDPAPVRERPASAALDDALLPAVLFDNRPAPAWTLPERMARHHVPGVGIALIEDGRVAWSKGLGRTGNGEAPAVDATTRFQAASLAKLLTAVAALRLVDQGKLDLDRDVDETLTSWKLPPNPFTATTPVTLRQLLAHRAGITVRGFAGYAEGDSLPDLQAILAGRAPSNSPPVAVDRVPGTVERYSGGGYQIVQQLVEDATGQPFIDVVRGQVLAPAGLARTVAGPAPPPASACGHGHDGLRVAGCAHRYPETAAAGWWSTPDDLARLALALARAWRGADDALLAHATARAMLTPAGDGHSGLGPGVHGSGDALHFDQSGWNRGFRARLILYPRLGKGIVVMANGDGGDVLINEIVRAAARTYRWPDFQPARRTAATLAPAALAARAGAYAMDAGFVLHVEAREDHLRVRTPRGTLHAFHPLEPDRFVDPEEGTELRFDGAPDEPAASVSLWGMQGRRDARGKP